MPDVIDQTVKTRGNHNSGSERVNRLLRRRAEAYKRCRYFTHTFASTDMPGRSILVS